MVKTNYKSLAKKKLKQLSNEYQKLKDKHELENPNSEYEYEDDGFICSIADLEYLIQDQLDSYLMYHTTAEELWHDKPLTFKKMEGSGELECFEMSDLHQRIYHYLKPFTKQEED